MSIRGIPFTLWVLAAGVLSLAGCERNASPSGDASGTEQAPMDGTSQAAVEKQIDAFGIVKAKTTHSIVLEFPAVLRQKLVSEGQRAQRTKIAVVEAELERLQEQSNRAYISNDAIVCDVRVGVVSEIGYVEGDLISRERPLCNIIDLDSIIVEASIPEEFIAALKIGSTATVVPIADNARSYEGTVSRIASLATKNNGETVVPVEITLDTGDGFLLPNFNVDVSIH